MVTKRLRNKDFLNAYIKSKLKDYLLKKKYDSIHIYVIKMIYSMKLK